MFSNSKRKNIIVFGDIMLDFTAIGKVNKLANEAPIPVLLKENETITLGGCGNVLQNLSSLGTDKLFLFSMCGDDADSEKLEKCLKEIQVDYFLKKVKDKKTTSKHRFFSDNKLLFRYDNEEYYTLSTDEEKDILNQLNTILDAHEIDCILFSDYNKGFLTKSLCQSVIELANKKNIFTCVDPKKEYGKYKNCSLIKPNRNEVEQMFGIVFSIDTLPTVHKKIKELVNCKNTVITLGHEGISGCFDNNEYFYWKYDSKEVIDVTGAGDIVNSVLSYYYPSSKDKKVCLQLASVLATQSVQHLGTYKLQPYDILLAHRVLKENKIINSNELMNLKKPIIFTNGCFDILHEGHISLFKYCKDMAGSTHQVVLGLNSDNSISRLKGPTRPIFNLASRLSILNAIEYIDWIVVFEEDTPELLIKELCPDILVKGGDYSIENVVGREYCREIKLFSFLYNNSTTNVIKHIKNMDF
jgi:D-beta-D-heptose 7-phosphate kinase/D-beta-D-heptose 1-phosphate adenosyltransferase